MVDLTSSRESSDVKPLSSEKNSPMEPISPPPAIIEKPSPPKEVQRPPPVNPWLAQKSQQEQDYAIRNLDPVKLFQRSQKPPEPLAEKPVEPKPSRPLGGSFVNSFGVSFRAPQDDLDCPDEHNHLTKKMGYPWCNIPKMIHGMRVCEKTGHVMYLVSWQQDF